MMEPLSRPQLSSPLILPVEIVWSLSNAKEKDFSVDVLMSSGEGSTRVSLVHHDIMIGQFRVIGQEQERAE